MMIGILISSFHNLNVEIVLADPSSNYYVANDGDDLNNGLSPGSPWRTIGKVNTELNSGVINAGDDIYFNRGDTFDDTSLLIRLGGTSSDNLIIGAYGTGNRPIFSYSTSPSGYSAIRTHVVSIGYIKLENLDVTTPSGNINGIGFNKDNVSNITISNCVVHDCTNSGMYLARINGYLVEDCIVYNCTNTGIGITGSVNYGITNGTIRNCTIYNITGNDGISLHDDGATNPVGNNHLILNCTVYDCGEQAFDFSMTNDIVENVLIKNCTGYNNGLATLGVGGFKNFTIDNLYSYDDNCGIFIIADVKNVIIRNCVIYNWTSVSSGIRSYADASPPSETVENMTVYNNDFVYKTTGRIIYTDNYTKHHVFKNNIFTGVDSSGPDRFVQMNEGNITTFNWTFVNNIWWRSGDTDSSVRWWFRYGGGGQNFTEWLAFSEVTGDMRTDPEMVDAINGNFSLNNTSPAIDAGDWLTTTNGGGSGTTVTVNNSNYFSPGITTMSYTENGDNIFIGDDLNLEVIGVDYNTETITVNRSITWSDGEDVSLSAYNGTAPDIGAYEFISSGPNTTPPEITNIIRITSDPLDTNASFGWINITATVTGNSEVNTVMINVSCPNGSSFNVSMNAIESNTYYYNTSTIFSNHGDFNYFIWANDTNGNQSTSTVYDFSMPPNWDINKDRQCTILDLILISNHYGETGQNGWIREDADNNGIIQMLDLILVSAHYYETW